MQLPRDRALLVYWLRQYCVPILVAEEEGKGKEEEEWGKGERDELLGNSFGNNLPECAMC